MATKKPIVATIGQFEQIQSGDTIDPSFLPAATLAIAAAGGTADAITATFSPALTLTDQTVCLVVAAAANATTTPTFSPNSLTAHTITARGGAALKVGDIAGALHVLILEYNAANTRWELLNPALAFFEYIAAAGDPASPVDGDFWIPVGSWPSYRDGGTTYRLAVQGLNASFNAASSFTVPAHTKGNNTNQAASTAFVQSAITPTVPAVRAVGTAASGTGTLTPGLPSGHTTNDILLLFVQSANQSVTAPAGYTQIGPQNGVGTAAASGAARLAIFWKRDGGSESAPNITGPGNRGTAVIIAVSGCPTTGNPFHFKNNGFKKTASTTATIPGGETTIDNMLVVYGLGHAINSASAQLSAETNSDLSSIVEQFDGGSTDGVGGGLGVVTGTKATAGTFTSMTITEGSSTADVFMVIAMLPSEKFQAGSSPQPTEVYNYITQNGGTDLLNIPLAAKELEVIAIGGGGAGGAGFASTAAGGGGGGGGSYQRKVFKALELISPLQIIVGKGGVGGATKSNATASVVKNNNGSGNTLINANFGVIGADAITGSGGNGGAGGGVGTLAAAGAGAQGNGGAGAGGGTGATTGQTGGAADMGGGGGGGGKNATSTGIGGASMYGGGGGGGGGSTGAGAIGGVGGGGQAGGASQGGAATETGIFTTGGSGGAGGAQTVQTGGAGAQPGGGGGGGGNLANSGGNGGDGAVVIIIRY